MSTTGPVGSVTVPAVAPSWPIARIAPTFCVLSRSISALTAGTTGLTSNGPSLPGKSRLGVASVVNPTTPSLTPLNVNTFDFFHSGGVVLSG